MKAVPAATRTRLGAQIHGITKPYKPPSKLRKHRALNVKRVPMIVRKTLGRRLPFSCRSCTGGSLTMTSVAGLTSANAKTKCRKSHLANTR